MPPMILDAKATIVDEAAKNMLNKYIIHMLLRTLYPMVTNLNAKWSSVLLKIGRCFLMRIIIRKNVS